MHRVFWNSWGLPQLEQSKDVSYHLFKSTRNELLLLDDGVQLTGLEPNTSYRVKMAVMHWALVGQYQYDPQYLRQLITRSCYDVIFRTTTLPGQCRYHDDSYMYLKASSCIGRTMCKEATGLSECYMKYLLTYSVDILMFVLDHHANCEISKE